MPLHTVANIPCTGWGLAVTSSWSPLGNFTEGLSTPKHFLILCYSLVITYESRIFCITFSIFGTSHKFLNYADPFIITADMLEEIFDHIQ